MINTDSTEKNTKVERIDTDGNIIVEDFEKGSVFIKSPKRSEGIKIFKERSRWGYWLILYESGKQVPGCQGLWLTVTGATKQVQKVLKNMKTTPSARYGHASKRPVLKRKKVKVNKDASDGTTS